MSIINLLLIAFALSMDAFAVSTVNGMLLPNMGVRHAMVCGAYFGVFQFGMPLLGYALGSMFAVYIERYDHWVAFVLLAFIGGKMLWDTFHEDEGAPQDPYKVLAWRNMVTQAIATSIDALAVGVGFAVMHINVWTSSLAIGCVTFSLSFFGALLGNRLGRVFKRRAQQLGGLVLLGIGIKILLEHLIAG